MGLTTDITDVLSCVVQLYAKYNTTKFISHKTFQLIYLRNFIHLKILCIYNIQYEF